MDVSPFRISKGTKGQEELPDCEQTGRQEHTARFWGPAVDLSVNPPVVRELFRKPVPQKDPDQDRKKRHEK